MPPITKDFPVFDCDGHVFEPGELWSDYVEPEYREAVRGSLWREDHPGGYDGWLNGIPHLKRRDNGAFFGAIKGPGVDQAMLSAMRMAVDPHDLTPGSTDPHARLRDMDAMGIDQAMLLPTFCGMWFTAIRNPMGALGLARAYNNWILDHASADPTRLFPAMIFPQHDNEMAVGEIRRCAELGFRCAVVRPNIVAGRYPAHPSFDPIWQALTDTGMVAGLHPFPPANGKVVDAIPADCCGWFIDEAANASAFDRRGLISETICFAHDAQTLLLLLFHMGFYDRFPNLTLAVLESNAAWVPSFLEKAESRVVTWTATRGWPVERLPTTAFREQSFVSFESDERLVFRLWDEFADIGVWASDYPHFDAEDAWEAIGHMRDAAVPDDVVAKLMGANAARMYGIEPRLVVREQPLVAS